MKNYRKTFIGSTVTFLLGTSCCWISSLAIWLGGASIFTITSNFAERYQTVLLSLALLFFIIGLYQFWKYKNLQAKKIKS